ncbi:MAG: hypothetical protein HFE63_06235 [Clostridiales bacterium]|nr:hypothetical protein [Clostridiales bacterium]
MKKILATLSTAALLSSLLAVNTLAAPAVAGRKTCEAYIADITVDGKIDDAWKYAPTISVDTVKENASSWFGDTSKVAGKDYATMDAKVLWDGKSTLYILYEIKDNTIATVGGAFWEKDTVEVFLQLDNSNNNDTKIQKWLCVDKSENTFDEGAYALTRTTDGFIFEAAFDVSAVGGAGQYLGIDFQYDDDAEGNGVRNICLGWSDDCDKASSDPSVYGQCLLSDVTVADLIAAEKAAAEAETSAKTADSTSLALAAIAGGGYFNYNSFEEALQIIVKIFAADSITIVNCRF